MLKKIPVILLLMLPSRGEAQFDTAFVRKSIRECADSLVSGFKERNWDRFTRYSYPPLVASMGGKEGFTRFIKETMAAVPDSAWKQYEPGDILQVLRTGSDLQAVIELHTTLQWESMRIITTTYLVGESWSGGRFWTFFDSRGSRESALQIKPDLAGDLVIPEKKEKMEPVQPTAGNGSAPAATNQ